MPWSLPWPFYIWFLKPVPWCGLTGLSCRLSHLPPTRIQADCGQGWRHSSGFPTVDAHTWCSMNTWNEGRFICYKILVKCIWQNFLLKTFLRVQDKGIQDIHSYCWATMITIHQLYFIFTEWNSVPIKDLRPCPPPQLLVTIFLFSVSVDWTTPSTPC